MPLTLFPMGLVVIWANREKKKQEQIAMNNGEKIPEKKA
jgi:hypothetical protein